MKPNIQFMIAVRQHLTLLLFSCFAFVGYAQHQSTVEADIEFANGGYADAIELYKIAYKKEKDLEEKARVLYQIAEAYRLQTDNQSSVEYYNKAITAQYFKQDVAVFYSLGVALMEMEKYDEAVEQFNKYKDKGGTASMADKMIANCENAALQLNEPPTRYQVEPEVLLNGPYFDFAPTYSNKKLNEIVFSSTRPSAQGGPGDPITGDDFVDLFIAKRDKKGKWETPRPLNNTVNSTSNEGSSSFDPKFQNILFTRCVYYEERDREPCNVMIAKRSGDQFGIPELIPVIARSENDSSQVGHPCLSPEGDFIVFVSDMPGGKGGKDIWYAPYNKKEKKSGAPVNAGDINTAGDEMFPYMNKNGDIFFSSDGHQGLGGLDIFKAMKTGDMTWDAPENMQYPINSSSDDFGLVFEGDKDQGLFTSNRQGGKGKDDIYNFKMPPLEFALEGVIYDDVDNFPIGNAKIIVAGGGESFEIQSDENGGFSLIDGQIKPEVNYSIDISKDGYLATGNTISTVGAPNSLTFAREYFLEPIIEGKEYDLPEVRYPFGKYTLQVDEEVNSKDSLNFLLDVMLRNPNIVVNLEAHTDTRGGDAANKRLSENRAKTCVEYLASKGIPKDRMYAVGKGESTPIISDAAIAKLNSEPEREAAHAKNRRTVFTIRSQDYKPKNP